MRGETGFFPEIIRAMLRGERPKSRLANWANDAKPLPQHDLHLRSEGVPSQWGQIESPQQ